jgi:hypothetical protein
MLISSHIDGVVRASCFNALLEFIEQSRIPMLTINLLEALPHVRLWIDSNARAGWWKIVPVNQMLIFGFPMTARTPRRDTRLATYFTLTSRLRKSLTVDQRSGGPFDRPGDLRIPPVRPIVLSDNFINGGRFSDFGTIVD